MIPRTPPEDTTQISQTEAKSIRIYTALHRVPAGRVISYGELAELAGIPRGARLVAKILSTLPGDSELPWHRVIKSNGHIAFPHHHPNYDRQRQLLKSEGVLFKGNRINMEVFGYCRD